MAGKGIDGTFAKATQYERLPVAAEDKSDNDWGTGMSENHESDETLLPDDADRKIEELMASLRESERELLGNPAPEEEPQQEETEEEGGDFEEDFLTDEESDFVDLDAEQLDNSTDKLELDESDVLEEELLQSLTAAVEPPAEEPADKEEELDSSAAEQRAMAANELARARLDELEQKLAEVEALPLQVTAPVGRVSDTFPGWIAAALALLAVVLSGGALWMSYNTPSVPASAAVAGGSVEMELQGLKVDLAGLRERISSVEEQATQGNAEALTMLDRMQAVLARVETGLLNREPAAETPPAQGSAQPAAGDLAPQPVAKTSPPTVAAKPEASAVPEKEASDGKVFVKGWAVNLRSYYHRVDAERLMQRYRKEGIDAEIREIPKGQVIWYRVRVMGFGSKQEANAFIEGLSEEQGRELAWPSYYQGYVEM